MVERVIFCAFVFASVGVGMYIILYALVTICQLIFGLWSSKKYGYTLKRTMRFAVNYVRMTVLWTLVGLVLFFFALGFGGRFHFAEQWKAGIASAGSSESMRMHRVLGSF